MKVTDGSGNIFADLGVDAPDEMLAKAQLAHAIIGIIKHRHMIQVEAAKVLGTDQAKISALANGRLGGFSIERLIHFTKALDRDVEIRIRRKPRSRSKARFHVVLA
ncbi:MAG TPA: XRE family transcriptional regulator [Alphaproteobacteria bacterium]|nr:XRE family transcriptional regulator [Alphaproteobacteria bacterium]